MIARSREGQERQSLTDEKSTVVFSLAVLPKYRAECIRIVRDHFGDRLTLLISSAHLDSSVRTGIPSSWFTETRMMRLGGKAFVQLGSLRPSIAAGLAVLDLNPRSLSAVAVLVARRALRRPTLVWGHIHPQAGSASKSAVLRRSLRRLAEGTISYTYEDQRKAQRDIPGQPVYVAPNSLYLAREIEPGESRDQDRDVAIYVGRLEPKKKPHLIIEALPIAHKLRPDMRVAIVGAGSMEHELRELAVIEGVEEFVEFLGWLDEPSDLRRIYSEAFCSLSPGFAGLGLTQSLGFGVPMAVAKDEPHSPEIELAQTGGVIWFESDSASSLAAALVEAWDERALVPLRDISSDVRGRYSAEAMSSGLIAAVEETLSAQQKSRRSAIPLPLARIVRSALRRLAVRGPVTVGSRFRVGLGARVGSTHQLSIGHDVAVGPGSIIQVNGSIGNYVMIGMNVQIVGRNDHALDEPGKPMLYSTWIGDRELRDRDVVEIADDVWIGAASVVLSGVRIGEGAVIAAGSVVTRDVAPYSVVAGNPAREVSQRFPEEINRRMHSKYLRAVRDNG